MLFGGVGRSKYNNVDKAVQAVDARYQAAGFTSITVSQTNISIVGQGGGEVTFAFGRSPIGLSIGGRANHNTGPAFSGLAIRSAPAITTSVTSEYDPFLSFGLSIGAPINIGRAVLVEPMLDLTSWKTRNITFDNTNGVSATTGTDRSGTDPGFGIRAAWFPAHMLGFGYELHLIKMNNTAPGLATAPWQAFLEDAQSMFSVYVRLK